MAESFLSRIGKALSGGGSIEKLAPTQTLGSSQEGAIYDGGGFVWGTPDPRLNLTGQQRYQTFDDMLRDVAIVAAGTRLFLNLIANAVWTFNPPEDLNANEQAVAQGYADQAYDAIFGMTTSWSTVIRKIAMYRMIGFSIMEWTAKKNPDGSIGFLDIEHRPQRTVIRWVRDDGGTIEAVVQRVNGKAEVTIPRAKIVYAVDDLLTDHPEGVGLFRHLASTAWRLDQFLELEEIGFTTDLRGIPIGRAPLGELSADVTKAGNEGSEAWNKAVAKRESKLATLKAFIRDHVRNKKMGMLFPSDTYYGRTADGAQTPSSVPKWALELLTGESTAFQAMAEAIKRLTHDLATVLGVEHLLLGTDGSGSLALARSKVGTFYLTVTSTLQELVEIVDRDVIRPLAELNGWPEELWPETGVNEITDREIEQVAEVLERMARAGAVLAPDDPAIGEMRDMLGLSRPPERDSGEDLSLNPRRNEPKTPDDQIPQGTEGEVKKRRMIRSRKRRLRRTAG